LYGILELADYNSSQTRLHDGKKGQVQGGTGEGSVAGVPVPNDAPRGSQMRHPDQASCNARDSKEAEGWHSQLWLQPQLYDGR
jgi:hypothetical protein